MALAAPAFAADAKDAAPAAADNSDKDIVVTGTLIRGTQATGSQTLTLDAKAITEVAAVSTNELLTSIPQISSFNSRPEGDPKGLTAVSAIVRPNLRNFPSTNSTSGALTLIMVDGMRLTPVGTNASSVDPDIIPGTVLQAVDIVTDGGSSIYGADAVAGVMNFRTMRAFEGVKLDGNFGFGTTIKGFHQWDVSGTVGKSWSTGNAYINVSHADRDSILNRQTSWANGTVYNAAGVGRVTSTTCNAPQATVTNWYRYAASASGFTNNPAAPGAGAAALGTGCDQALDQTYLPSLKRTNVFAALSNSFSDSVDLRVTAYWVKREIGLPQYPLGYTSKGSGITSAAQLTAAYPAALNTAVGSLFAVPEGVGFALGPNANYVNTPSSIRNETWGVSPELTVKLNGNWSLRTSLHYGQSNNWTNFPGLNTTAIDGYITSGAIVPTNIAAASASVISDITNWETAQNTKHELFMFRTIADGKVFTLPGGDAKLAVGLEYDNNRDSTRVYTGKTGVIGTLPFATASGSMKSAFAELHLPVVSFAEVAASVRHDSYTTFGNTTNPNVGLTLKPTSWLKVFGHWGTSYNAPTPYDSLGLGFGRAGQNYVTTRPTIAAGKTDNGQGSYFIVLTGASPAGLKPQTSDGWALGFDATPVTGLNFGAEFYSINLDNAIGNLNPANAATYQTNPSLYIYNNELTANNNALFNTIMSQLQNGAAISTQVGGAAGVAILVDTRTSNLNSAKVQGIDFHLNYQTQTPWGVVSFTNAGNIATRQLQTASGATTNELGHGQPRFTWASALGLTNGGFTGRVMVNYSGKYHDGALNNLGVSQDVPAFVITNLFLGYNFAASGGALKGTSLRLTVDNLFDKKPYTLLRPNTNNPNFNGWTLGRVIKLGFTEQF
ncbi:MAG: TonB-dependent receptor [Sphingomonadales bacterium]|nr:TonB-dependent receptor [Sphingomonadales bacterium]